MICKCGADKAVCPDCMEDRIKELEEAIQEMIDEVESTDWWQVSHGIIKQTKKLKQLLEET